MCPEAVHSSLFLQLVVLVDPGHHLFEENGQGGDGAPQVEIILTKEKNLQKGDIFRWVGLHWD